MKSLVFATMMLAVSTLGLGQSATAADEKAVRDWTGVWTISDPALPGGRITVVDDGGSDGRSLAGTITFNVKSRETGERIAIEVRSLVNPHVEGDALVFQVRHILRPHLKGETEEDVARDTELATMRLERVGDGKGTMACLSCGNSAPLAMEKER